MALQIEPVIKQNLAKQISETLREAILSGSLKVDERLPSEPELASRFNVSRPTIREALKRLAAQNLIRSRRGPSGGTFVNRPDHLEARNSLANMTALMTSLGEFTLKDIAVARRELERTCIDLAMDHMDETGFARLQEELRIQSNPDLSDEEFCASDVRFHRALVDGCGNAMLCFLMSALIEATQPIVNLVVFRFWDRQATAAQHQALYDALRKRDRETALDVLSEIMNDLEKRYQKAQEYRETKSD